MGIEGLNIEEINSKVRQYWSVSVIEETGSTQKDLREKFIPNHVLIAEYQSEGRGRLDRKFEVPKAKGLTFSFAINVERDFGWIPLITGLAVADAINTYVNENLVALKWPNDLLISEEKLGGILCEQVGNDVVVGVGINIYQTKSELPISQATSLSMHSVVDRTKLMVEILNTVGHALANIEEMKHRYRERCSTIGRKVSAILPNGEIIDDLSIGISDDGSLKLRSREVSVADIVHLR